MTIFGWDMSHFDAPSVGNAIDQGIEFITHKAGGDATDAELPAWWAGVRSIDPSKVLLGAYWVLYPGNPAGRADAFIARLNSACPGWRDRPFILQADCEKWNDDPTTVPSRAEIATFCNRLVELMPKLRPVVYAPKWVYGDKLTGLTYPLWASSYVTGAGSFKALYPGDGSSHWGMYSGQAPAILQFTSSATIGGQSTCDANAYRGTKAQLEALVAPGWSPDMTTVDLTPEATQGVVDKLLDTVLPFPYDTANPWRKVRDLLRYIPSKDVIDNQLTPDFTAVLAAIAAIPPAPLATDVANALLPELTASILAALPAGTLTAEQVTSAVVEGTKTVLRDGVGA
jgi:hypothetical protein